MIMKLNEINKIYGQEFVRRDVKGFIAPVLRPLPALRYLLDCLESGHKLLGVSGFHYLKSGKIQPDQVLEIDRSDYATDQEFLGKVGELICSQIDTDAVFEIAFEDGDPNSKSDTPA